MHFTRVLNHLFNKLFSCFKKFIVVKLRSFCSHYKNCIIMKNLFMYIVVVVVCLLYFFPLRNLSFVRQLPNNIKSKSLKI